MSQDSARIFALKLHALHHEDREWIIDQLNPIAQSRLKPLLKELDDLGLVVDPKDIDSISNKSINSELLSNASTSDNQLLALIDSASASQVERVFDQEPNIFFNYLIAIHDWKWGSEFNSNSKYFRRGSSKAKRVEPNINLTPKVKHVLLAAIVTELGNNKAINIPLIKEVSNYRAAPSILFIQQCFHKIFSWKR